MNKLIQHLSVTLTFLILMGSSLSFATPLVAGQQSSEEPTSEIDAKEAPLSDTQGLKLEADNLEAWLDGFMSASLKKGKIAGAVVSIVKDGKILLSKGFGYADEETEKPMDPALTLVRPGSTSKLFTWTAVMQLVEQGKLDLDQDVNTYLDFKIPDRSGGPITMNDLMTHRGGFEEGLKNVLMTDPDLYISTEQYLKDHPRPRVFPAGVVPAYSNYGTALAGYIVELISGQSFDDYIDQNILTPLRMENSTFRQPLPEKFQENMSKGYMTSSQKPWPFELVTTAPAGSLSATANDMANFMIAHLQEGRFEGTEILKPETARLMYSPSYDVPEGFASMAHGFFNTRANGRLVLGHGGDTVVFHTTMNLLPEEGVGIFINFNSRGAQDSVYGIRSQLFADFMERYYPETEETQEQPAIEGAKAHAQEIAGSYQSSRRIETAFLGFFYLLQQSSAVANEDGTLSFASQPKYKFTEIATNLWKEPETGQELYISRVDGVMTIVNSGNPTSVQQQVTSIAQNGSLNTNTLIVSISILILALLGGVIGWWYRRVYGQPISISGKPLLAHRITRALVLGNFLYLFGWYMALNPVLVNQLDAYGPSFDGTLRMLQIAALIPIAAAVAGIWNAWLSIRSDRNLSVKLGNALLAASLLGIVWIGFAGKLISFNMEY